MNALTIIQGIGSIGFFSSRAFLPAFITALLLRFGGDLPGLENVELLKQISGSAPVWFTSNWSLLILGLLSALEVAATKNEDARKLLEDVDQYFKPIMAAVTFLGLLSASDVKFVEQATGQKAGFFDYPLLLLILAGTYFGALLRNGVLSVLSDADEDDDIGVQKLISWAEDVWVVAGLVILVLYPVAMLILIGLVTGLLALMRVYAQWREDQSRVPCASCGELVYLCALACPKCKTAVAQPRRVGFLGQSKSQPTDDLANHPYRLVEKKRCPVCATRLTQRAVRQRCAACGHELNADARFAENYLGYVGSRVPLVCGVSALFSLVPVVGLIPGVIYYRMALVAPLRRYLPFGRRFLLKWAIRVFFFFLIFLQLIPVAGAVVVPLMAVVSYGAYRSSFAGMIRQPGN